MKSPRTYTLVANGSHTQNATPAAPHTVAPGGHDAGATSQPGGGGGATPDRVAVVVALAAVARGDSVAPAAHVHAPQNSSPNCAGGGSGVE